MDVLWEQINNSIHSRDVETARALIPRYIKAHDSAPEALYEASEFYRKITDYSSALRVLPKERTRDSSRASDIDTKLELQLARLLNILGASNYALRLIDRIRREDRAKSKIEMVEIYQCNYKYAEVVELLGESYPLPATEPWHQDWLLHFYLANALSGLKETGLAIKRVERIGTLSKSPLIRAMASCYHGKYLLAAGKAGLALPKLIEARSFFADNDSTADAAIFQMHLGHCFLMLENFDEAKTALEKALRVFYQPAIKPEDWMEIVLLLDQIPGYREQYRHLAPRLRSISGPGYPPLTRLGLQDRGGESDVFSISKIETSKSIHFDRISDTAWKNGRARLGLELLDELICYLIYAGEYGLPQYRIYELLWPNEPFSFDQLQKRLEHLVGRARDQGYEINWKDLHLYLASKDVTASARTGKVVRGYSFLLSHPTFTRKDVEAYFSVSKSTANVLCGEWARSGLVKPTVKSKYCTLPLD